jgi:hypothetical protein
MDKQRYKILKANTSEMFEQTLNSNYDPDYMLVGNVFVLPNKNAGPHGFEIMQLLELKDFSTSKRGKMSVPSA